MSREIAFGLLNLAGNGNEILSILDVIESSDCAADNDTEGGDMMD
jgi:hypothetical protein